MLLMFMVRIGALKDEAEKKEEIAEEEKQNSSENVERKDLSFLNDSEKSDFGSQLLPWSWTMEVKYFREY